MNNYFEKMNEESQFIIIKNKTECLSSKFDCQES